MNKNFQNLALRAKILLALAGLAQEFRHKDFFSAIKICQWLEDRTEKLSQGKIRAISRKLKEMREHNRVAVDNHHGNKIGEVQLLSTTKKRPFLYKIGERTVETRLSAKLVKNLDEACPVGGSLPKESEATVVSEIYEEFKNEEEYKISDRRDVVKKVEHAVAGFYFTRDSDGLLRATRRLSIDESDFIGHLSEPLLAPIQKAKN